MTTLAIVWVVLAIVPWAAQDVGFVFAPLCLVLTWRFWIWGVHIEPNGPKVCGLVVTRHVAWADVDRFAVLPAGRYPYVGQLIRKGHQPPIVILAISSSGGETEGARGRAQGPVDQLNEILTEWRQAHGPREATTPA